MYARNPMTTDLQHGHRGPAVTPDERVVGRRGEGDAVAALPAAEVQLVVGHLVHQRPVLAAGDAAAVEPVLLLQAVLGKSDYRV